ncbi:MAG: twin-arginine translocation signal domain-containing protein, partial [Acidobacteriota bacterium]|nr:twin-arginine translocation signal domain-containing protein [Acidobacteriota bacterium]
MCILKAASGELTRRNFVAGAAAAALAGPALLANNNIVAEEVKMQSSESAIPVETANAYGSDL